MTKDQRATASSEQQIEALMRRGLDAASAGQRARARRYFAAVLEMDPTCVEAWLERAAVLDDPQEVMVYLARALELDPGNERAKQALRVARRAAANQASYAATPVPLVTSSHAPVPHPLVAVGEPKPRRDLSGAWIVAAVAIFVLLLGLLLRSDAPRTVMAALLPSPTPTPTNTPTPTPTFTPTPTPTNTPTPTPTYTPSPTPTPTNTPTPSVTPTKVPADKSQSEKWIEVDLSDQRLYAHEGQRTVLTAVVSTGTRWYPTVKGRFKIYVKYRSTRMRGPGYNLPNVPWTMYFYGGYAIHGTYWHNNFGRPMSHGCVNMKTPEAKWLFQWAPKGTLVVVHQ